MKFDKKMIPLLVKGVVALGSVAAWYFLGKPVDETEVSDLVEVISCIFIGKEFLPQTGDK
jgi:hypothetical protein